MVPSPYFLSPQFIQTARQTINKLFRQHLWEGRTRLVNFALSRDERRQQTEYISMRADDETFAKSLLDKRLACHGQFDPGHQARPRISAPMKLIEPFANSTQTFTTLHSHARFFKTRAGARFDLATGRKTEKPPTGPWAATAFLFERRYAWQPLHC
jgi:hypothetical protein